MLPISYVPSPAREADLSEAVVGLSRQRHLSEALPAVEQLVRWATQDERPLCALLGDVGMGKTTATKWLTLELLKARETDPDLRKNYLGL